MWGFVDPLAGRELVGFGTIQISCLHSVYTSGLPHFYIPALSLRPGVQSYGYGRSIVEYLIAEAAVWSVRWQEADVPPAPYLLLDVYTANTRAIELYRDRCQFVVLNPDYPDPDPDESNEPYYVMGRNVQIASST